jgi:succinate-semialdehyde dehydrogenase/glutarate-semialdehyde dehydrogenase
MKMLIAGEWVPSETGRVLTITDPATGDPVGEVPEASAADVNKACEAATTAFSSWRRVPAADRARLLHAAAAGLRDHTEALASALTSELGRPIGGSRREIERSADMLDYFAEEAIRLRGEIPMMNLPNERVMVVKEPVGVVVAIAPFNYPISLLSMKLGPALATGCTVVAKPSSLTPLSTLKLAEVFEEAGFPPGVLNVVTGRGSEAGRALVEHPIPRKVSFTGGTEAGKTIAAAATRTLKRLTLELGGQSPAIVGDDADIAEAIPALVSQAYANSGQFCYRVSRIYAGRSIYDEFCEQFAQTAAGLRVGSGFDPETQVGPVVDASTYRKSLTQVDDAIARGAQLLTGGQRLRGSAYDGGYFMPPTVLSNTDHSMLVMREETFGPVVGIMAVDDLEEATRLANDSPYGLAAYVYCGDTARALRVAEQCEAGTVWVNGIHRTYNLVPFGGYKESGLGREKSRFALDEYIELKTIYLAI